MSAAVSDGMRRRCVKLGFRARGAVVVVALESVSVDWFGKLIAPRAEDWVRARGMSRMGREMDAVVIEDEVDGARLTVDDEASLRSEGTAGKGLLRER